MNPAHRVLHTLRVRRPIAAALEENIDAPPPLTRLP
jgi:hypothetical protein